MRLFGISWLVVAALVFCVVCAGTTYASDRRIMPGDFEYLGAFLTPPWISGTFDGECWEWGGMAMAYDPMGDPMGRMTVFLGPSTVPDMMSGTFFQRSVFLFLLYLQRRSSQILTQPKTCSILLM